MNMPLALILGYNLSSQMKSFWLVKKMSYWILIKMIHWLSDWIGNFRVTDFGSFGCYTTGKHNR